MTTSNGKQNSCSPMARASSTCEPLVMHGDAPISALPLNQSGTWRNWTWRIIGGESAGGRKRYWPTVAFQVSIMTLIMANVALVIIDTEPGLSSSESYQAFYDKFELVSVTVFGLEYVLRFWCAEHVAMQAGACRLWGLRAEALVTNRLWYLVRHMTCRPIPLSHGRACVESNTPACGRRLSAHPLRGRVQWAASPLALIDLVALIPFIFDLSFTQSTQFRGATLVRLLRTFSMLRMERR